MDVRQSYMKYISGEHENVKYELIEGPGECPYRHIPLSTFVLTFSKDYTQKYFQHMNENSMTSEYSFKAVEWRVYVVFSFVFTSARARELFSDTDGCRQIKIDATIYLDDNNLQKVDHKLNDFCMMLNDNIPLWAIERELYQ